jgi:thiosulfate dehydrogenase
MEMARFLIGFTVGLLLIPVAAFLYLYIGRPPVAVDDPPFPLEKALTQMPLRARIGREMHPPQAELDADGLVAGARVYVSSCAMCHGYQGKNAPMGKTMFPAAPQLWKVHGGSKAVGVSDDPPGETYWKVKNGIRLTGMPGFKTQLTEAQMWQVTLLLANADKPLPKLAESLVSGEVTSSSAPPAN